ncbi:STAS domain-containing protein [Streptomyces corynorhini]|uniref:STAS domain-containing protein n=1 Tax=Streptomyces corynorhini TaxID=2282652 RepID=UPI001F3992EA|nr:STAS domain-containing protein [Streptomyces corynorhini]
MDDTKPTVLVVAGHIAPADVPRRHEELAAGLPATAADVVCDVGGLVRPTLAAVELLALLQLTARRRGCRVALRGTGRELRLLLDLVGLGALARE